MSIMHPFTKEAKHETPPFTCTSFSEQSKTVAYVVNVIRIGPLNEGHEPWGNGIHAMQVTLTKHYMSYITKQSQIRQQ
jgi:hypothetical protein